MKDEDVEIDFKNGVIMFVYDKKLLGKLRERYPEYATQIRYKSKKDQWAEIFSSIRENSND